MNKKNFVLTIILSAILALVFLNVIIFTEIIRFGSMFLATFVSSVLASLLGLIWVIHILLKNKYEKSMLVITVYIVISILVNIIMLQGYLELFYKLFFDLGAGY